MLRRSQEDTEAGDENNTPDVSPPPIHPPEQRGGLAHAEESEKAATLGPPTFSIGGASSVRSGFNHFCVRKSKRHGRSSGMRRGRRSSSSGVRTSASPSTTGTADGWVACLVLMVFSFVITQSRQQCSQQGRAQKQGTKHNIPAAVPPVTGTAGRREPHVLLVFLFGLPAEGDSNPRLQGSSRLRCRCGTRPQTRVRGRQPSSNQCQRL